MTFFRPITETAPNYDPELPWPFPDLAYVVMFGGIACGPLAVGLIVGQWIGALVGVTISFLFWLLHGWLFDAYVEKWMGALQPYCKNPLRRMLLNFGGFVWAISVTFIPIMLTLQAMYSLGAQPISAWVVGKPSK